jgi:hypothetical protein
MSKLRLLYIPDVQVKEGVETDHILAAGRYIVAHRPDVIVVGGDWWDMPSCSMFNTKKSWEGLRIKSDLDVGHKAMELFLSPLHELQAHQRKHKKKLYSPRLVFTVGNHDPQVRIPRLYEKYPELEGMFTIPDMTNYGFEEIPFMDIVTIEGINFSHFFVNPHSAKKGPLGGAIDTMLKNAGFSFVQGHQQGLKMGKHYLANGTCKLGIVAGSFYQHDEEFMGIQGNKHWRGVIMLNEVENGAADICEISLDYLRRKYL